MIIEGESIMNVYEGKLIPGKIKVGIVAARFNEFITSRLLSGALDGLRRHEVGDEDIDIAWVPGAFEIPLAASKWLPAADMTPSSALGPSSAAAQATMTMYAARFPRESPMFPLQAGFR